MRTNTSSPGVSGPQRGQCRWGLTTRDGERQGRQGSPAAGAGCKGPAEKLETERLIKTGPNFIYT